MIDFYLGGDVSKGYCDFIFLSKNKQELEHHFQLDDTAEGHKILTDRIAVFFSENPDATLHIGFESTGGYENNWINLFQKLRSNFNLKVARLNSLGVCHNHRADLKRNVTDKISARNIAEYLISHEEKVYYNQDLKYVGARRFYRYIERLTKQNTQLLNDLEKEVYGTNPELLRYWGDDLPNWLLSVINRFPTAGELAKAGVDGFKGIKYMPREKGKELIKNAEKSVASANSTFDGIKVKSLSAQIMQKRAEIKELKKQLEILYPLSDVEILTSIPGIAQYTAYGLIFEIDGIERFKKDKNLCSYWGIHPVFKKSGDGNWGYRMSKQGRSRARRLLFLTAMNATQNDDMFKMLYGRYVKNGKNRTQALCIIMHKIVRIVYAMLKNKTKYSPTINLIRTIKNQHNQQNQLNQKRNEMAKTRRLQVYDEGAPISARQKKMRERLRVE